MEIWKNIKGYEKLYQVSNLGNIRSLDRYVYNTYKNRLVKGKIKKLTNNEKGYLKVTLYKNGKSQTREVQRIVAETFIHNIENKPQVNHIDGNKHNNRVENLEWVTAQENTIHSIEVLEKGLVPVLQYDLENNFITAYYSVKEAGIKNNIKPCSISNCINGRRKTAGGYIWVMG
jgi:hypothetical protein